MDYMYSKALHVIQVYQSPGRISITNILTGAEAFGSPKKMPQITAVLDNLHIHPLIDHKFSKKQINVSFCHCPPGVIDKHSDGHMILDEELTPDVDRFDGVEFQLMAHITKKWTHNFTLQSFAANRSCWRSILMDVHLRRSHIAMCGLWLDEDMQSRFDLSQPYFQQCITFLVPRLPPIPRDQYIYLALQGNIWIFYTIIIVCISMLVYFFVSVSKEHSITLQLEIFIYSILQVLAIATQHSITKFPHRFSAKLLFMSWFFFSFLLAAIYSTGYTSIVTTLLFNKPINTVPDMIDKNLRWGDINGHFKIKLSLSSNKELTDLAQLTIDYYSEEAETLFKSLNYAQVVSVLNNGWVTDKSQRFENASSKYRVMNTCIYNSYTVFAFQKNSPYLKYFNKEIPKYVESGLLQHWLTLANVHYGKRYIKNFFIKSKQMMHGPFVMTVADIAIGLYILGIGLVISTWVFIAELCCWRFKTCNKIYRFK
ncbi:uncharacterized protein DMENIID0001_057370 [Sergentomyia squamirostris]